MKQRATKLPRPRIVWCVLGALWLGAAGVGLGLLAAYDSLPGVERAPIDRWPAGGSIPLSSRGGTLVLFAHPHCPCTRASLGELEEIVARCQGTVTPWIVFFKPSSTDDDWHQTDLWRTAAAIPGAHVLRDVDGREAERFRATTSGHTVLYSDKGDLLFSGGITFARGHSGDNAGQSAIEACLAGDAPESRTTPVFGCPISVPGDELTKR
jgi:hypothetical protein